MSRPLKDVLVGLVKAMTQCHAMISNVELDLEKIPDDTYRREVMETRDDVVVAAAMQRAAVEAEQIRSNCADLADYLTRRHGALGGTDETLAAGE